MPTEASLYIEQLKNNSREAIDFGRLAQSLAAARGHVGNAVAGAEQRWGGKGWGGQTYAPRVIAALKAMLEGGGATLEDLIKRRSAIQPGMTSDSTWAGPLAPLIPLGSEFVSYLRPRTILGQLNVRKVPFQIKFPRATSGASAGFVQQGAPMPVSRMSLDTLSLGFAKMGALVIITDELARFSSPDAAATISGDAAAALSAAMDEAFIDPDRAAVADTSPASITYGAQQIASSGTTGAQLIADSKAALKVLDQARVPLNEVTWIVTQDLALHIASLLTTTGEPAFEDFSFDGGKWLGLPALVSGSAFGANSASEGLLIAVHGPSVAVADDGLVDLSVSGNASLQMDDAPAAGAQTLTSLWQENLVALKVTRFMNWLRRRDNSVAVVRGINV